ncbi:MAG TPA: aminotransferase class I/II-fold pyridoxal phosphate-dependent enzyme [Chthoniobacterales bacterium]|nr:aminotransferase class I/II-fold pyridoxal phosphate-dependent enzyme [Chthoniobacterales bacterium]
MSQAFHGGGIMQAEAQFGLPAESFIDFSSNVNVLAPTVAMAVWAEWRSEIDRYSEPDSKGLAEQLAGFYHVSPGHIVPTAGASEALYLSAQLFAGSKVAVLEPAFSDYSRAFSRLPCLLDRILLEPDLWDRPATLWADRLDPFDVIVLGNPNNPTGSFRPFNELIGLFDRRWTRPKRWIIDEAFIEFVVGSERETLLGQLTNYPSLIIVRSLTKSWRIPGLRLGFLATAGPIQRLRQMQPPWSINGIVQAWAKHFLVEARRPEYLASLKALTDLREDFQNSLRRIPGIRVHSSAANFLLVELTDVSLDATRLYTELGHRGILVRVCDSFYGMPKGRFLRVAVRSALENNRFLKAFCAVCANLVGRAA